MKFAIFLAALALPTLGAAYPNPNIVVQVDAGDLVDQVLTQPKPTPLIVADRGASK